ncbi:MULTISPECIES: polysaccharide transport system component protein [Pandoraea]|uniref:Polysaccharide transport system component protein n=1 Tax=Pandoraea communis TaxID=2508297 RepID=A0A5E4Y7X8_9BURK|nr:MULTISPECIES: polysaccharide transport system component protein [Pandoraea]EON11615.1 polysaccharide transport system component protein [Pandoraea sp. SD6-2]VVE44568.1 polysaccharide transport system component protein [Pandoraea communis]
MPEPTSKDERATSGRRLRRSDGASGLCLLRWACTLGLAALAVGAQAQALRLVMQSEVWDAQPGGVAMPLVSMSAVLGWQAVAALLAGGFTTCVVPASYRGRRSAFWHIALITFFLPGAGLSVVLGVLLIGYLFPPPSEAVVAGRVTPPGFISHLVGRVRHGAGMRLRARLRNLRGERDDRVAALVSVQALPSRVTSEIARDLLADPVEEVRLLAYGILDGMEKRIMQQIYAMRDRHAAAQDEDERAHACRHLAQLYWELIYQNLVRGEVLRFTMERVEQFARDTLEQHDDDASMWYLLGRCALLRETPDVAEMYLRQAQFHSFPTERLLPWLAEAAFQKRRYDRVAQLLGGLGASAKGARGATASQAVQPAVRFWTR